MDFGAAIGVVSLSFQVFGGCVRGFVLLSTAHNLGKDAAFLRALLNLEEYRFVQWAEQVGLKSPESRIDERLNQALAAELMGQLEQKLDTNKLKERYKLELVPSAPEGLGTGGSHVATDTTRSILGVGVTDEKRREILTRASIIQDKNHLPRRLWWAAVDKRAFETLVADVRLIIDGLWALLDPVKEAALMDKLERTASTVVNLSEDMKNLAAIEASFRAQESMIQTLTSLATAAAMKSTRIAIGEMSEGNVSSGASRPQSQTLENEGGPLEIALQPATAQTASIIGIRRKALPPPLRSNLLEDFRPTQHSNSLGIARYGGHEVFVEHKTVPHTLKEKLRSRVEDLAAVLSQKKDRTFLTLSCLGFFEEGDDFVFVYKYPDPLYEAQALPSPPPITLLDLLRRSNLPMPSVTVRLALALHISRTVLTFHTAGWLHKSLRSNNILFFPLPNQDPVPKLLATPYLVGFAFSRLDSPAAISEGPSINPEDDIYRHEKALGEPSISFQVTMDLYSLGTILIEIAEWRPLKHIIKKCVSVTSEPGVTLAAIARVHEWLLTHQLSNGTVAFRMGDAYSELVAFCLDPRENEDPPDKTAELSKFYDILRRLEKCSI